MHNILNIIIMSCMPNYYQNHIKNGKGKTCHGQIVTLLMFCYWRNSPESPEGGACLNVYKSLQMCSRVNTIQTKKAICSWAYRQSSRMCSSSYCEQPQGLYSTVANKTSGRVGAAEHYKWSYVIWLLWDLLQSRVLFILFNSVPYVYNIA